MSAEARPQFRVEPVTAPPVELPEEFESRRLVKRTLQVVILLGILFAVVLLSPGLGEVRDKLADARPGWIAIGVALEGLSCLSYVLMFRPIFCRNMRRRTGWEIAWSELAMGSIVPASGAGPLALGAWILHQGGMPGEKIARRSVAFFLVKSGVNFVAVAVLGFAMALGVGPHFSLWLTVLPAVLATATIVLVALIPRLGPGESPGEDAGRFRHFLSGARRALITGTKEALEIIRKGEFAVVVGAVGYWFWDNAVLWATFHAFGYSAPVTVILMGYLIGQLGGALPLPGGLGGIDGGLLGTLIVYGTPAAVTAAAVLAYRLILFWLPLLVGVGFFISLRRGLNRPDRPDLCVVPAAT